MTHSIDLSRGSIALVTALAVLACSEADNGAAGEGLAAQPETPETAEPAAGGDPAVSPNPPPGGAGGSSSASGGGPTTPPPGENGGAPDVGGEAANEPPEASFTFVRGDDGGRVLEFDASSSSDPDGEIAQYLWDFGDGTTGEGKLTEHEFGSDECFEVQLTVVDDQGARAEQTMTVSVYSARASGPSGVALDPLPGDFAVLPRNVETNEATLEVTGSAVEAGYHSAVVNVTDDAGTSKDFQAAICNGNFAVPVTIPAALRNHKLEVKLVGTMVADETIATVNDLVAGDIIVVQGQSNGEAAKQRGSADGDKSPFIRTFGNHGQTADSVRDDVLWRTAEGDKGRGPGSIGQWALRMSALLTQKFEVPIAVINHANGGKAIGFFQRDDENPANLNNNYGRMLHRIRLGNLTGAVRAIMFFQGESDNNNGQKHKDGFTALHADWLEDYPNTERFYVTQIRPGCGGASHQLLDVQRRFADTLPKTSVMTANGLSGHDGCHYYYDQGYKELGEWYAALLGRDLYNAPPEPDTDAVNVESASFAAETVRIETRGNASALNVEQGVAGHFSLAGTQRTVTGVTAEGTTLVLSLSAGNGGPTHVRYVGPQKAAPWITNAKGIGLLSFDLEL